MLCLDSAPPIRLTQHSNALLAECVPLVLVHSVLNTHNIPSLFNIFKKSMRKGLAAKCDAAMLHALLWLLAFIIAAAWSFWLKAQPGTSLEASFPGKLPSTDPKGCGHWFFKAGPVIHIQESAKGSSLFHIYVYIYICNSMSSTSPQPSRFNIFNRDNHSQLRCPDLISSALLGIVNVELWIS